jgi:hypothetical protein
LEYRFRTRFEQRYDAIGFHYRAVALVHDNAAAGGYDLPVGSGDPFEGTPLDAAEFILAVSSEDVFYRHSLGRDYLVIGIHKSPAEKAGDLFTDGCLASTRESCDENVGSGQRTGLFPVVFE